MLTCRQAPGPRSRACVSIDKVGLPALLSLLCSCGPETEPSVDRSFPHVGPYLRASWRSLTAASGAFRHPAASDLEKRAQ